MSSVERGVDAVRACASRGRKRLDRVVRPRVELSGPLHHELVTWCEPGLEVLQDRVGKAPPDFERHATRLQRETHDPGANSEVFFLKQ